MTSDTTRMVFDKVFSGPGDDPDEYVEAVESYAKDAVRDVEMYLQFEGGRRAALKATKMSAFLQGLGEAVRDNWYADLPPRYREWNALKHLFCLRFRTYPVRVSDARLSLFLRFDDETVRNFFARCKDIAPWCDPEQATTVRDALYVGLDRSEEPDSVVFEAMNEHLGEMDVLDQWHLPDEDDCTLDHILEAVELALDDPVVIEVMSSSD